MSEQPSAPIQPRPQNPNESLAELVRLQTEQNATLVQVAKNLHTYNDEWKNTRKQLTFFYWFVVIVSTIGCFVVYFRPF